MSYLAELTRRDELIARAQAGDRSAEAELVESHTGRVRAAVYRLFGASFKVTEDAMQEGMIAFLEAVRSYDSARAGFWHFAKLRIHQRVKRHLVSEAKKANRHEQRDMSGVEAPQREPSSVPPLPPLDCLDERQRQVVEMRFGMAGPESTLREIGEQLGLGVPHTHAILNSALEKLRHAAEQIP